MPERLPNAPVARGRRKPGTAIVRSPLAALAGAVVLQLGLLTATPAGAAPRSDAPRTCGRLAGPTVHWNGRTWHHYVIGTEGAESCAAARGWVARIVREKTPASSLARPRGPAGWSCVANATGGVAFNGSCRGARGSFRWGAI